MWLTEETGYTPDTYKEFAALMPQDWALEGQVEQGKDSQQNLHCQLRLKTPQCRGTRVAKFFPKCHIEPARNKYALGQYVHKADTRVAELKTVENKFPRWTEVRNRFYDWFLHEHGDNHPYLLEDEHKLRFWDQFIGLCQREGLEVDIIGVNPQYRSCIIKYWNDQLINAQQRLESPTSVDKIDRQTEDTEQGVAPPIKILSLESV